MHLIASPWITNWIIKETITMQNPTTQLRLSHVAWPVTALGPGHRLVIWTAGCPLRCHECITPELQDMKSGKLINVDKLFHYITSLSCEFDGITITGGEPFIQSAHLSLLWKQLKKNFLHWNLIIFSGYSRQQWKNNRSAAKLLKQCDVLIDGPFIADKPGKYPLLSSANQSIIYLTTEGKKMQPEIEQQSFNMANFGMAHDNSWLIGIIDKNNRTQLHKQFINKAQAHSSTISM